ncbi:hypothetical protein MMC08_001833 [Hypocenomyce scalaris]|nr:hypothetical protein [Hypocenomyce scalaris]
MSRSSSSDTIPLPSIAERVSSSTAVALHSASIPDSATSSTISSDNELDRVGRTSLAARPKLCSRKSSGTIIVPLDHPNVEIQNEEYPPEDARAMSPRGNSEETDKLSHDTRRAVQEQAKILQSGLSALAERIETVKADHDKLEKQNVALQDYIGGLTRSMSSTSTKSQK